MTFTIGKRSAIPYILSLLMFVGLIGCGGGGGSAPPPPPPPSATGFYDTGDITDLGISDLQGMVNGTRLMMLSAPNGLLYDGEMVITGTNFTVNFTVYENGLNPIAATATGSFVEGSSMTGVISGGGATVDGTFNLSYALSNNDFSAISKINSSSWGSLNLNGGLDGFDLDANAQITIFYNRTGVDFLDNCTQSASDFSPIASTRLYAVSITLTSCTTATYDGTYTGLATTKTDTVADDRMVFAVAHNSNIAAMAYDMER